MEKKFPCKGRNERKQNKRAIKKWTQAKKNKREREKSWKLKRKRDNKNVIKETPEMVFSCWNLI